jgi:diacylglycerol kinase (ATP)
MKLLFVINPTSGTTENNDTVNSITEVCRNGNIDFRIFATSGKDDDAKIQAELADYKPTRIAACGGDGTVQLVARNLINKNVVMGILPQGSANGLATALGIPKNLDEALPIFINSKNSIPLDLIQINEKFLCIHLSDVGTNALLVKSYEEAGDKGILGYAKHLISSIQQSDLMQFEIKTDEGTYNKEGYMLVIANAHKYGTGVQISEGSVSDGKFEICNVQTIDLESAVKAGLTAINIFLDKNMFSDVISCEKALIKIHPQAHLQIDGEYIGEYSELRVSILTSAINVLVK